MTEPRANAVRWPLINGGIHLTSSCCSRTAFPSRPLAAAGYKALTSYTCTGGTGCLPTSATRTICNPANRAQRLRDSTRSRGVRYKLASVSSLAGPTYAPQSLIFRLRLFNIVPSSVLPINQRRIEEIQREFPHFYFAEAERGTFSVEIL